ncbi:hypothetical protein CANCADRAFT_31651 [Tortispora caseinolytica NRRL Y-17796]|uniref:Uncharacterized protein n=1 Tax=Tortispora caseinolytica NRRL Y-17796 TaxID=767744 RepID=A0A1E4TGK6_9ASCO|nr:hypothetical protein CANCADRAFT_31651 [Tortispora caseinolytica NRRL Y-17796]
MSPAAIETWFTKTLGVKYPVMQGGMQWVGRAELAAAVSNAGGLGTLTALTQPTPEALREEIRKAKKLTDKPIAVNITLLPSMRPPNYESYAQAALDEGIKIFETAGNMAPILPIIKKNGAIVIHKCVNLKHALIAQRKGVDCISIDGFECAGHPGEDDFPGLILLSLCRQQLKIPFIASGGFADGYGLAAALTLGATAVNMGTRIMCTVESPIHHKIKETIVASDEYSTTHIFRPLRNTSRVYKNSVAKEVNRIEKEKRENLKFEDVAPLVAGTRGRTVYENGDPDAGIWTAGLTVGLIHDIPTCQVLLERIGSEAIEALTTVNGLVKSKL